MALLLERVGNLGDEAGLTRADTSRDSHQFTETQPAGNLVEPFERIQGVGLRVFSQYVL